MTSDPAKAASGNSSVWRKCSVSPKRELVKTMALGAAASAPPLETPTSAGSASGFRNSPCMIAPAAASRPPTIAVAAIRGMRIDHSTSWSRAVMASAVALPARPSAAGSRARGMPAAPTVSATIAMIASAARSRGSAIDANLRPLLAGCPVPRAPVPNARMPLPAVRRRQGRGERATLAAQCRIRA